jgi:hypothetical protein
MDTEPPQDLRRLVHSTANRVLEESLRNLRQHNEVRRLIARGELTDLELNAAYHDYERQAGALYRQAVADLTVRYHAGLAELGVEYSRRFYEEILAKYGAGPDGPRDGAGPSWSFSTSVGTPEAAPTSPPPAAEAQRPKRVALELHAPLGSVASGAFSLENRRDEVAEVSFEVSPWTASDGSRVEAPVVLSPPEMRIGPRSTEDVTIAVRLAPEVFALDQLYTTNVAVKGYDGLELLLTVWAEPTSEPEPEPAPAPPRKAGRPRGQQRQRPGHENEPEGASTPSAASNGAVRRGSGRRSRTTSAEGVGDGSRPGS